MTSRELVLAALAGQPTPRTPWVPFVGTHGGALIGIDAATYLKSADHILSGMREAVRRYRPDGLPVVFDLQIEGEALGCDLHWSKEGPPSITTHPLGEGKTLADLPALDLGRGRIAVALEATRRARAEFPDLALYGLICGPFTLAMHLWGNDIFMAMFDDPAAVRRVLDFTTTIGVTMAEAYRQAGCDVIAVVDPMISQISPEHVTEFFAPYADRIFSAVRNAGAKSSLFVCGDASPNLHAMAATACDNISIDENVDLSALRAIARHSGKSFGGNLRLTVALLMGTPDTCRRDALRCLDAGGDQAFICSPGCDLPYAVPAANLEAVAELIHDPYRRETVRAQAVQTAGDDFADVAIPDYPHETQTVVDIITLDSATCPPCQYMVEAVRRAGLALGGRMRWVEHKITQRDGLAYMTRLGVSHIPTICINGKPAFVSRIPDQKTLVDTITGAVTAKGG